MIIKKCQVLKGMISIVYYSLIVGSDRPAISNRYPGSSQKICQYPQDDVLSSRKPKLVQRFFSRPPIRKAPRQ
jgi:hypothetical protein